MVQFQRMNARLDTLTTKLYQVNTRVGHIARWQARLGGFVAFPSPSPSPSPSPKASEDEDVANGNDDDDNDEDASSSSDEEMTTS